jgi:hypothetical protein
MHHSGASRRGNAKLRLDFDDLYSNVVPAKAGTHNHRRLLEQKPLAIVPKARPRRMGPRVRGDDAFTRHCERSEAIQTSSFRDDANGSAQGAAQ